jgi:hypothetical protein
MIMETNKNDTFCKDCLPNFFKSYDPTPAELLEQKIILTRTQLLIKPDFADVNPELLPYAEGSYRAICGDLSWVQYRLDVASELGEFSEDEDEAIWGSVSEALHKKFSEILPSRNLWEETKHIYDKSLINHEGEYLLSPEIFHILFMHYFLAPIFDDDVRAAWVTSKHNQVGHKTLRDRQQWVVRLLFPLIYLGFRFTNKTIFNVLSEYHQQVRT